MRKRTRTKTRKRTRTAQPDIKPERKRRKKTVQEMKEESKFISTTEAAEVITEATGWTPTTNTIRNWCAQGLGHQIGSKWLVDIKQLQEVIDGTHPITAKRKSKDQKEEKRKALRSSKEGVKRTRS